MMPFGATVDDIAHDVRALLKSMSAMVAESRISICARSWRFRHVRPVAGGDRARRSASMGRASRRC